MASEPLAVEPAASDAAQNGEDIAAVMVDDATEVPRKPDPRDTDPQPPASAPRQRTARQRRGKLPLAEDPVRF